MYTNRCLRGGLAVLTAVVVVASLAASPALAVEDGVDTDVVTDGVDDALAGDATTGPQATGDVSIDLDPDDQSVVVEGSGTDGSSTVEGTCELSGETGAIPCEVDGGPDGDVSPDDPTIDPPIPTDPGSGPALPPDPAGTTPPSVGDLSPPSDSGSAIQQTGTGYFLNEEVGGGAVQAGVLLGEDTVREAGVRVADYGSGSGQLEEIVVFVRPDEGTTTVEHRANADDRASGTRTRCDVGGWTRPCSVTNDPPVFVSDTPATEFEQIPGAVYVLVDGFVLKNPTAVPGFALATAAAEVPEDSPVDPSSPPYDPDVRPFDYTQPSQAIDPTAEPRSTDVQDATVTRYERGARLGLTEDHGAGGLVVVHQDDAQTGAGMAGSVDDGQNQHGGVAEANTRQGIHVASDGVTSGQGTLGPSDQRASGEIDLGGQPYGATVPPEDGESGPEPPSIDPGSLPADPSQLP